MRGGLTQKRCPKCGGNIFLDRDSYGWYEQCLQCSHTSYLDIILDVREKTDVSGLVQAGGVKSPR